MNFPEHLQISLDTIFEQFSQQNTEIMTHQNILSLLNFAFQQLGMERSADQNDLSDFLKQFDLQNKTQINKQNFGEKQFLNFTKPKSHNNVPDGLCEIKIAIQPFVKQLQKSGCTIVPRQKIRQFLVIVHNYLQIPKPVEDQDIEKFISDFDKNQDGQIQLSDLQGIDSLKFFVRKCRKYS